MGTIFISYRREDSQAISDRMYDWLSQRFGRDKIAYDVDSIRPGVNFAAYISQAIKSSSVVLVIIGKQWLTLARNGERRLDDPDDYVRREIETALRQNHIGQEPVIIPILVDEATMPARSDLPPSIAELAVIQALPVRRNPDFDRDMHSLFQYIAPLVHATQPPLSYPPAPSSHVPTYAASSPVHTTPMQKKRNSALRLFIALAIIISLLGALSYGISRLGGAFANKGNGGARPAGATNAVITASVLAYMQQCATAATESPVNCPQRLKAATSAGSLTWSLHGDPGAGAEISYTGNNHFQVVGVFVMTAHYDAGSGDFAISLDADDYKASVTWDTAAQKATVSDLEPYSADANGQPLTIQRPSTLTDGAARDAMQANFNYCAAQTNFPAAPLCPQFDAPEFSHLASMKYTVKSDPITLASVTYDNGKGIVHINGSYVMDADYIFNVPNDPSASETREDSGNYEAYVTLDNGIATVIYVNYNA